MKYYVQINRRIMTAIEASSALSAEHCFLDMDGIQYACAFDNEGRKTDCFRGALIDCQPMSLREVEGLSLAYRDAWEDVSVALDRVDAAKQTLHQLRDQLKKAEEELISATRNCNEKMKAAKAAEAAIGKED